jgi:hypothetical protein
MYISCKVMQCMYNGWKQLILRDFSLYSSFRFMISFALNDGEVIARYGINCLTSNGILVNCHINFRLIALVLLVQLKY